MPLLDLSLVTSTLQTVIKRRVQTGLIALNQPAAVVNAVAVSALPPDQLTGDVTLGLFLYHVQEDAQLKNLPPVSSDTPPVRFTPMGINLFYQLTAHSGVPLEPGAVIVQRLFGLAVKALRDFPTLDKDTTVDGALVFPTELQGTDNRFRITLQSVPPNDAQQFWTAGSQPVRLAAYYQVSAVLLEPELPSRYSGRVLRYGVQTFVRGAPHLDASQSTVVFRVPGESSDRKVDVQPAEVPVGGQMIFLGNDLNGDTTTLLIKHTRFPAPIEVGLEWGISATEDRVFATVQALADSVAMLPGIYSAMVKVTQRKKMPDGSLRAFSQSSNAVPFTVTPTITTPAFATVATADVNGIVVIQGRLFSHPDLDPGDLKVLIGPGEIPREPTAVLTAGHFEVVDGTTIAPPVALDDPALPFVIRLRFPIAGLNPGDVVPLRVRINGAENAPRWVVVP
jgi:hypothetical protein